MASKVLLNITKEDHEKARQLSKLKYELDMQSRQVRAKRAARAEGKLERDKELYERAKSALAEGIPIEIIQKITGLDLETLLGA